MKRFQQILPIIGMTIALMLGCPSQAEAAEGKPGERITVTFTFNDVRGVDGMFAFSNEGLLTDISYSSSFAGARFNNNKVFYSTTEAGAANGTITVTATIRSDAAVGDKCTISLDNINITDAGTNAVYSGSKSEIVTVVAGQDAAGGQGEINLTEKSKVNLSELKNQIQIANGLKKDGYTKASWNAFADALAAARDALNSTKQKTIDKAAKQLKDAMDQLTKMDYSRLQEAIADADSLMDTERLASMIEQLMVALNNGALLMESDDQQAVDAATDTISQLTSQIRQQLIDNSGNGADQDVVTEPTEDYCNIPSHKVWNILFFISLGINLVLAALLVFFTVGRKKRTGADMPIVDYDIEDDGMAAYMDEEFMEEAVLEETGGESDE